MISPAEADRLIGAHVNCFPIESLPLTQCAGSVLRENIYGERDQPPFDRVAMDGIALDSAAALSGSKRFRIQAMQAAGDPPLTLANGQQCIETMTGAMLPTGCDAVVPVERIRIADGYAHLEEALKVEPGLNVHRRGTDSRQGDLLLSAGVRLRSPEIAVAASAGMPRIRVSAQPRLIVLSTGNELIEPGQAIAPHQVRRSNVYAVVSALREHGFSRVADDHVVDDFEALCERLRVHLDTHDGLILSGGVSMGKLDLVPRALESLGVRRVFHRIAQRPGKPMWYGLSANGTSVFALPGNPVSTLVCLTRYVVPALCAAMGATPQSGERLALSAQVDVRSDLAQFVPVKLQADEWGRTWARPCPTNGSGDFTSLVGTDGFVELPPGPHVYPKGFVTRLYRW
jgi:molybdopterin molybdotransferase